MGKCFRIIKIGGCTKLNVGLRYRRLFRFTHLGYHRVGIDLTHVDAAIILKKE